MGLGFLGREVVWVKVRGKINKVIKGNYKNYDVAEIYYLRDEVTEVGCGGDYDVGNFCIWFWV